MESSLMKLMIIALFDALHLRVNTFPLEKTFNHSFFMNRQEYFRIFR